MMLKKNSTNLAANPELFSSRTRNRLVYGGIGTKDLMFKRTFKDLYEHVTLECDGVNLSTKLKELKPHCLLFLNIPKYAGGKQPWGAHVGAQAGAPGSPPVYPPSYSDRKLEVIGLTATQMATVQFGHQGHRLAQCSTIRLITKKSLAVQVDGEPTNLAPSKLTIRFMSQAPMLQRISVKHRRGSHLPTLTTDPNTFSQQIPLYTVGILNLAVSRISRALYDKYREDIDELLAAASPLPRITIESEADLEQARSLIIRNAPELKQRTDWIFVDYVSGVRTFRIDRAEEQLHSVSDVCSTEQALIILDPDWNPS